MSFRAGMGCLLAGLAIGWACALTAYPAPFMPSGLAVLAVGIVGVVLIVVDR